MSSDNIRAFPAAAAASDELARTQALDTRASCIVEAPAGSGKTGLLVQRFLKLLTEESVERPEEVLAITFTRKATAEMQQRVLEQLQLAHAGAAPPDGHSFQRETRRLAEAALARSAERGWDLLHQPQRLNIRTFDAVSAQIAKALPVLSGSGGDRSVVQDAHGLYRLAAVKTLRQLGGTDRALDASLRTLLLHRDANLADCATLIAEMLEKRDQWGHLVPLDSASLEDAFLDGTLRQRLERTLAGIVEAGLQRVCEHLPGSACEELHAMATAFAERPHKKDPAPFAAFLQAPRPLDTHPDCHAHWVGVAFLLLTGDGDWRKKARSNYLGFEIAKHEAARLEALIAETQTDALRDALAAVSGLPPATYPEEQWLVVKALFRVLRHALAELKLIFAAQSECDFTELALAARQALREDETASDLALSAGGKLRHLLIDEMQDTSAGQYDLIQLLTRSWDGHSQTLFLVGDPKQSIYLFRSARVERFLQTMRDGRLGDVRLRALRLTANFRSQETLVRDFNRDFKRLFPSADGPLNEAMDVPFVEAVAQREVAPGGGVTWHTTVMEQAGPEEDGPRLIAQHRADEARELCGIVRQRLAMPLPAGRTQPWRVAVLGRNRNHLGEAMRALQAAGIAYKAVNLDPLGDRAEVLDALALTRALLHPADRTAWLAVLHAPWCGLGLADLLRLSGDGEDLAATMATLVKQRQGALSKQGRQLLERAWKPLQAALDGLGATRVSVLVERTWRSLGGDAALGPESQTNVERFFALLRELEAEDGRIDSRALEQKLDRLYAEPTAGHAAVEVLTIHNAKGLEWDLVLVPRLEGGSGSTRPPLLNWLEFAEQSEDAATILLAPIAGRGERASQLSRWLSALRTRRDQAEARRLFYVAATRASEDLHLFATATRTRSGLGAGAANSLLRACWSAAQPHFEASDEVLVMPVRSAAPGSAGLALAASAEEMREATAVRTVQRLPAGFDPAQRLTQAARLPYPEAAALQHAAVFERPQGSFGVRAYGNVVHRYLQVLSERLEQASPQAVISELAGWQPRLQASLRGEGLPPAMAAKEAGRALQALLQALADPIGLWLLGPQKDAVSESSLSVSAPVPRTMRVDRSFVAGPAPGSDGASTLWIVDYKTSEMGSRTFEAFKAAEVEKYREQLEAYAALRRGLADGHLSIELGLYYPAIPRLLHWTYDITG